MALLNSPTFTSWVWCTWPSVFNALTQADPLIHLSQSLGTTPCWSESAFVQSKVLVIIEYLNIRMSWLQLAREYVRSLCEVYCALANWSQTTCNPFNFHYMLAMVDWPCFFTNKKKARKQHKMTSCTSNYVLRRIWTRGTWKLKPAIASGHLYFIASGHHLYFWVISFYVRVMGLSWWQTSDHSW